MDFGFLICNPINIVTPASAAATIATIQISLSRALRRRFDFLCCREWFSRWRYWIADEHDDMNGQNSSKTLSCTKVKCEKFDRWIFPIPWFRNLCSTTYDSDRLSSREFCRIFLYWCSKYVHFESRNRWIFLKQIWRPLWRMMADDSQKYIRTYIRVHVS